MVKLLFALRTWCARFDPAAGRGDELGMGERRQCPHRTVWSLPWIPGPKNKRLCLMMFQQSWSIKPVILRTIRHSTTHHRARQYLIICVLPSHGERRQMPIRSAGRTGTVRILRLVTAYAVQCGHTFAFWTTDDIGEMTVTVIALLRIVCRRVTVDAARRS